MSRLCSTSSCRPRSSSRSPTPSRVCRATARPAAASPPPSRPAPRSRYRCSSRRARRSRSTPATAATSVAPTDVEPSRPLTARSKARKRAFDLLFEADQRGTAPLDTLNDWLRRSDPPVQDYAREIVEGVAGNLPRLDEAISSTAREWSLERMPSVDRAILRLATYELLCRDDVPVAVVIDEAVELAKSLSTDDSPAFVNGVLARVKEMRPAPSAEGS